MRSLILVITLLALPIIQTLPSFAEQVETVDVPSGNMRNLEFDLIAGENFIGSFTVSGGVGNDIKFWASNPQGKQIILQQDVTKGKSFSFIADQNGPYTLFFDNSFEVELPKKVTLTYEITNQESKSSPELLPNTDGGCLIATAAFGSELAPQVQFLREIRDNTVLSTASGTSFMTAFNTFYYSFSPAVADLERQNPLFKETVKVAITPLLSSLSLLQYVNIDSEAEMLGYGISIILLNIGMYFVIPALIVFKIKSKIT